MQNTTHVPEAVLLILLQASGLSFLAKDHPFLLPLLMDLPLQIAAFIGALAGARMFTKEKLPYYEWILTAIQAVVLGYAAGGFFCEYRGINPFTKTGFFVHIVTGLMANFTFRVLKLIGEVILARLPDVSNKIIDMLLTKFNDASNSLSDLWKLFFKKDTGSTPKDEQL